MAIDEELEPDDESFAFVFIRDHLDLDFDYVIKVAAEICREFSHLDYDVGRGLIVYHSDVEAMNAYLREQLMSAKMAGCFDDESVNEYLRINAGDISARWKKTHVYVGSAA